jgi:hypothetical protein
MAPDWKVVVTVDHFYGAMPCALSPIATGCERVPYTLGSIILRQDQALTGLVALLFKMALKMATTSESL